jgi:Cytidylate kinase
MKKFIITISREYGSGGRKIGQALADEFGVKCYDRAIIEMVAEKTGLSTEFIEKAETNAASSFAFSLSQATITSISPNLTYDLTPNGESFITQAEILQEIAARESAVIIGRCADYVLREHTNLINVFLVADKEDRLRRSIEEYGLTEKEAKEQMKQVDKGRAVYYRTFTGAEWGYPRNNDLYINTSRTGIEGAVAAIKALVEEKTK